MNKNRILLASIALAFASVMLWLSLTPRMFPSSPSSPSLIRERPIAEFEKTYAIVLSEQLLYRASGLSLIKTIIQAGSKVFLLESEALTDENAAFFAKNSPFTSKEIEQIKRLRMEHSNPWLRDFFPLPILKSIPHLPSLPSFVDFIYRDGSSEDDSIIHELAKHVVLSLEQLPLVLDGGNFMSNGKLCLLTDEIANDPGSSQQSPPALLQSAQIQDIFRSALGCEQVILLSQIAHPHVDMFIKFVRQDTALVAELEEKSLALLGEEDVAVKDKFLSIKKALDRAAESLKQHVRVIRIPSPLPMHNIPFTYVNSMIVNDTVIIPRYRDPDPSRGLYPDQNLYAYYEEKVVAAYTAIGLKPVFLPADDLIKDGGAFHCVSFHLPDLDGIIERQSLSQKG